MQHEREKSLSRRQAGFTLIEVLIVIAIFSIGILGAMSMQISAVGTNATTRKSTLAVEYATDTMERLMQIGDAAEDNKFGIDDDGDGSSADDTGDESQLTDGIDNDDDGSTDEADELEWHQLPEFANGGTFTRGANAYFPEDAYYDSIFNLNWTITDIDCDGDGTDDAKRIDITVSDNGQQIMQLTNIRTNIL
ncbi:MAG: prepilin-type N-terminal cleavage/methylation domain-containing protein [Desulfobacteraceae bacterium]|nr:prepilin-type N-terminal cleavage/methylation domain-containing protein [Desulfobacteraceae bacterium]